MGVRVNGARPVLSGVTEKESAVLRVTGSHYLIEGFDITAGGHACAGRCFDNVGDDVTLRDSVVHDCPFTGISGADASGLLRSTTWRYSIAGTGYSRTRFMSASAAKYPKALFTMRYCYVHDGVGGNNVKSRVTRNEIEYNWIEGAAYHELDLVVLDPNDQQSPAAPSIAMRM